MSEQFIKDVIKELKLRNTDHLDAKDIDTIVGLAVKNLDDIRHKAILVLKSSGCSCCCHEDYYKYEGMLRDALSITTKDIIETEYLYFEEEEEDTYTGEY